jgi:hypothetical protein
LAFSGDQEYGDSGEDIETYYTNFIDAYKDYTIDKKMKENGWDHETVERWLKGELKYSKKHKTKNLRGFIVSGSPPLLLWSSTKTQQDSNELLKNILDILEKIPGFEEINKLNINIKRSCMLCRNYEKLMPGMAREKWPAQLGVIEKKDGSKISEFFNNSFMPKTLEHSTQHCYVCNEGNICKGHSEVDKTGMESHYGCIEVDSEEGFRSKFSIAHDKNSSEEKRQNAKMQIESYTHRTPDKVYRPIDPKPGKCHRDWRESYDVQELPELLIIDDSLLKRFEDDYERDIIIANRFSMVIEGILDIPTKVGSVKYKLSGICHHLGGESPNSGHYIAIVKGNDSNYYIVNDLDCPASQRCNIPEEHYEQFQIDGATSNGSVLCFYEKVH